MCGLGCSLWWWLLTEETAVLWCGWISVAHVTGVKFSFCRRSPKINLTSQPQHGNGAASNCSLRLLCWQNIPTSTHPNPRRLPIYNLSSTTVTTSPTQQRCGQTSIRTTNIKRRSGQKEEETEVNNHTDDYNTELHP